MGQCTPGATWNRSGGSTFSCSQNVRQFTIQVVLTSLNRNILVAAHNRLWLISFFLKMILVFISSDSFAGSMTLALNFILLKTFCLWWRRLYYRCSFSGACAYFNGNRLVLYCLSMDNMQAASVMFPTCGINSKQQH